MKVKVISRNPDEYTRETKKDIHKGEFLEAKVRLYISLVEILQIKSNKKPHFLDSS